MAEPLPLCYLNGEFLPLRDARISPLDRGFLYADGVYEVMPVYEGRPFRFVQHFARLDRSLAAIRMDSPHTQAEWAALVEQLTRRNGGGDQYVYLQVTRGAEYGRNHAPLPVVPRTVFAFCAPLPVPSAAQLRDGLACVTAADIRWARCDIKSVSLLANVLLRQLAVDADAQETILLRDGWLTDASASTVHVVKDGTIITPPDSRWILPGTTRTVVEELAVAAGIASQTRPLRDSELRSADEIWLAAATRDVSSVTRLDGRPVGSGRPGPLWQQMRDAFQHLRERLRDVPWQNP